MFRARPLLLCVVALVACNGQTPASDPPDASSNKDDMSATADAAFGNDAGGRDDAGDSADAGGDMGAPRVVSPVKALTSTGDYVCNTSNAFSQLAHTNYFVGRGFGTGTLDECHSLKTGTVPFLALFQMDWVANKMVMQSYIQKFPASGNGYTIGAGYDPSVATYRGEYWVAFECTVAPTYVVSSCLAPLKPDMSSLDLDRLSVPAEGTTGNVNNVLVTLTSASAPTLFQYSGELYLYWQIDYWFNTVPTNHMVTRGMALEVASNGAIWGQSSNFTPTSNQDPKLTTLVNDVDLSDDTSDHVAVTTQVIRITSGFESNLGDIEGEILQLDSLGGTKTNTCRSTHDVSLGCWRMGVSITNSPLGVNNFGAETLSPLAIPANVMEYPRLVFDPNGNTWLFALFEQPTNGVEPGYAPPIPDNGLGYISISLPDFSFTNGWAAQ